MNPFPVRRTNLLYARKI